MIFWWNGGFLAGPVTLMSWETSFPQLIPKRSSRHSHLWIQVFCWPLEITAHCNSKCKVIYIFGSILEGNAFSLENLKRHWGIRSSLIIKLPGFHRFLIADPGHLHNWTKGWKPFKQVVCSPRSFHSSHAQQDICIGVFLLLRYLMEPPYIISARIPQLLDVNYLDRRKTDPPLFPTGIKCVYSRCGPGVSRLWEKLAAYLPTAINLLFSDGSLLLKTFPYYFLALASN